MTSQLRTAGWSTLVAIAIGGYAIAAQYHPTYLITAAAEDMCPYFYGAYALKNVEPAGDSLVVCTYE